MPKLTERVGDVIAAAVLFVVGLSAVVMSGHMPAGRFGDAGPGFFPAVLGIVLCLVSLAIAASNLRQRAGSQQVVSMVHRDSWSIVGGLVVMAVLFDSVGALPMIGLYVLFLLKRLSTLSWLKCLVFSAATAAGGYVIFDVLLGIPLPGGILF